MKEPKVHVGILFEPQIEFTLLAPYRQDGQEVNGNQTVTFDHGRILWQGRLYDELLFEPEDEQNASFELHGVTMASTSTGSARKTSVSRVLCASLWKMTS